MSRSLVVVALAALLLTFVPAASAQLLSQEQNVTVDSMLSDRFTWIDASGQIRSATLAHNNNGAGPGGSQGGELREYQYETGGGTRLVRNTGSGASGFGYAVSHPNDPVTNCIAGDSSSLGHFTAGTLTRVFTGRHHAIFRFQQNYPRLCTVAPPAEQFNVPVTMDWVFSTGWDHPLWAITWDYSGVPVGRLMDDSRAPYGELLFYGSATEDTNISGVAWGERYRFTSTGFDPLSYNSGWNYTDLNSVPHSVPFVKLWTEAPDATMGTVQTQTMSQQDAGGYFGIFAWGFSSAFIPGNSACIGQGQDHVMPCDFNWPYQSVNYSLDAFGDPNSNTTNTRLAWGTNFGFLGQATYPVMGSADPAIGGPVGDGLDPNFGAEDQLASGHPKKSYSTFIVLGLHSLLPVEAQRVQIETVQITTFTAAVGTVLTSGPAGVNRTDPVTYAPAGWNHVYAGWGVQAAGNAVDVNWNPNGQTLRHPLIIVSNWGTNEPSAVRYNGTLLTQDVDYFPSVRPGASELWLTLNQDLVGPLNRLEIDPGTGPPPPPPGGSGSFFTVTPCRVADTRNPAGPSGGPALGANTTRTFPAAGLCGIPTDATAVAINVTVVEETDFGNLRLYPAGGAVPTASTINFSPNHVRANNAIIPLGTGGEITVQCDMLPGSTGTTQFLFDVTGYFK